MATTSTPYRLLGALPRSASCRTCHRGPAATAASFSTSSALNAPKSVNKKKSASITANKGPSRSSRQAAAQKSPGQPLAEAALFLQALRPSNLDWSAYELEIHTKPNPSQNVNTIRGRVFPPHAFVGSGKKKDTIVVFAEENAAQAAKDAGADVVGGASLATQILEGHVVPTKLIAHPNMMSLFTPQMARFLGPKGLMPSERRGTVTSDLTKAVREAAGGLDWKADALGCVRSPIGRLHMSAEDLQENVKLLVREVSDLAAGSAGQSATAVAASSFSAGTSANPESKRRAAIKRVLLSSTQGPSIELAGVTE